MTDRSYRIGLIRGDGIGPEVLSEALRVLEAVSSAEGFRIETTDYDLGAERYLRSSEVLPASVLGEIRSQDSVLLGAVGDPRVPPGVLEIGLLLRLRQELDLYVNLRPSRLYEGVPSALAGVTPADLNLTIVRENTEGLYAGKGEVTLAGPQEELATEVSINTTQAVRRVTEYAFELAAREGRSLTMVHKVNVLERAGSLWQRVFKEIAPNYPDVPTADESGLPGFEVNVWYGFAVPAATPKPAVQKLNAEIGRALRNPSVAERLDGLGLAIVADTPEEFARFVAAESEKMRRLVQASGARVD